MNGGSSGEMTFEGLESGLDDGVEKSPDGGSAGTPQGPTGPPAGSAPSGDRGVSRRPPLPTWVRVTLMLVAVLLILVGIAGLVLPGIQGIVTILAGFALLSLVSRRTHRALRWSLGPWPRLRKRVEKHRHRFRRWLHRVVERFHRD